MATTARQHPADRWIDTDGDGHSVEWTNDDGTTSQASFGWNIWAARQFVKDEMGWLETEAERAEGSTTP